MTERLHFHFSLSCTGEGNGNPLQCDLAWRIPGTGEPGGLPDVYGVAQSQTRLKRLSSSSSSSRDSPSESNTSYTLFLLMNTLLASLLSVLVEILCRAERPGPLSLTTGLVARIWCSHCVTWPQSLAGNLSPASSHCRLRLPEITLSFHGSKYMLPFVEIVCKSLPL